MFAGLSVGEAPSASGDLGDLGPKSPSGPAVSAIEEMLAATPASPNARPTSAGAPADLSPGTMAAMKMATAGGAPMGNVAGGGAGAPAGRGMAMGGGTGGPQVNMQMAMMQQQMAMMQQQIAQQQMMMRYGGAAGAGGVGPRAPMPMGYGAPPPSGALPANLNELDDASKAFGFMGNAGGGSADAFDFVKGEITKNKGAI